ncbi:hypothetical protein NDU88_008302 [Pleurodeles waltl]|uniref:Uncharacterized protein n=1 Tax=Pleurodeles waltl TaxID=8319 RepID=A0AAV7QNC5_PLEWA|nr:hypothetical protein NDU88_008302 [Pleurodeles waltl]
MLAPKVPKAQRGTRAVRALAKFYSYRLITHCGLSFSTLGSQHYKENESAYQRTVVLPGGTPCPRILFAAVWGRSPECERLKRNTVSRNAGKELWCCLGGLLVPGSCLLPCGGGAQNASAQSVTRHPATRDTHGPCPGKARAKGGPVHARGQPLLALSCSPANDPPLRRNSFAPNHGFRIERDESLAPLEEIAALADKKEHVCQIETINSGRPVQVAAASDID